LLLREVFAAEPETWRRIEKEHRRYATYTRLVEIADPAARAQFESLTPRSETVAARAAACVQELPRAAEKALEREAETRVGYPWRWDGEL
jgi:hypothetical protein